MRLRHLLMLILSVLPACTSAPSSPRQSATQPASQSQSTVSHDNPGHSHERGKMLIVDAGKHHALLTAHLSPHGNELDIFFETAGDKPAPVALPIASFKAQVQTGEEIKELDFEPASADERPKDEKPGACSHFVAKAPWMKPTDNLYILVKLPIDGAEVTIRWKDFQPSKYAHHVE